MVVHKARWVLALFSMMSAALLIAWSTQTTDEMKRVLDTIVKEYSGDIEVTFHVRSTNGDPLHQVGVSLTESRFGSVSGSDYEPERFVFDSEITIKKRDVSAIHLSFFKDRFYDERWEYLMSQRPQEFHERVYQIEVEVLMTPIPDQASLLKIEGPLRSNSDGPVDVLFPTKKMKGPRSPRSTRVVKSQKPDNAGPPFLYIEPGIGADGDLETSLFRTKAYVVEKPVLSHGYLRITSATEGDGFTPVDIGDIPAVFERGFRKLETAPRTGYSDSLELTPIAGREKLFFYCRIGGRFGKGVVTSPPLILDKDDRDIAIARVVIFLNPTGSRNVAYVHY